MKYCSNTSDGKTVLEWCLYLHSGVSTEDLQRTAATIRSIAADDIKELLNAKGVQHTVLGHPKIKAAGDGGVLVAVSIVVIHGNVMSSAMKAGFIVLETDRLPTI